MGFRINGGYQTSEGQRDNGDYNIWQADGYLGYHPDSHQSITLEFHASRFNGGDPGKVNQFQFDEDQNFATTPYNENWVYRYSTILGYELEFGDGWLMQAKGWFTHQEIDARVANNPQMPRIRRLVDPTVSRRARPSVMRSSTMAALICVFGNAGAVTGCSAVAR